MPYFVISNFASGMDKRRSSETAASGSLRVLRNAFINEGGEIEKRKAFVRHEALTEYGQKPEYKGRIAGPYSIPGKRNAAFFRHRHDSLPGAPFVAGSGAIAESVSDTDPTSGRILNTFWVQKSLASLPLLHSMLHAASGSEFSNTHYSVEAFVVGDLSRDFQHLVTTFTNGEPTSEAEVGSNAGRGFQRVLRGKGYVASGQTVFSSAVGDPSDMAGTGAWSNDLSTQGSPIGEVIAIGEYFGQLVLLGQQGMQFWQVDPDPNLNQYLRTVPGSVYAPRSVTGYADGDILFLDRSGIRSLQARDSSNQARVSDVGSPLDAELRNKIAFDADDADTMFGQIAPEITNSLFYNLATGIVHRDTGHFWLALRDKIYVLSRYPSAKVLAWAEYDLPRPEYGSELSGDVKSQWVADWCPLGDHVALRNFADEFYLYGGPSGAEYDTSEVEVILPFMDMGRPGSIKNFTGIDVVCDGEWVIEYSTEFRGVNRDVIWAPLATVTDGTRAHERIGMDASATQIALRLTCKSPHAAKLAEVMVHYLEGAQK